MQTPARQRVYLDNAATSWPKPDAVYQAVDRAMRVLGAPAGRGVYHEANEVERAIVDARRRVAELMHAESAERIVFTSNGTDSLNLALHGLLRPGDHVVTSVVEHNSVLRPLRQMEEAGAIEVARVRCDEAGIVDATEIQAALKATTRLIALTHASNVTGAIQPVEQVGAIAHRHEVFFLIDAAQTLGQIPINVQALQADLLAAPGHKGLLGPLGTGVLYVAPGVEEQLDSIRQGGTGTHSDEDRQPRGLPSKYESGNHNVPGILGLRAALQYLAETGVDAIGQHEQQLVAKLVAGLAETDGVTIYGPLEAKQRASVVSINLDGYRPQELATMLDTIFSIQVRAGIHCAPLVHQSMGTAATGGTVRFSPGAFNTEAEIDTVIGAVREIHADAART